MIKAVIFDAMGVIFKVGDDTNDILVPYIQNLAQFESKERIVQKYLEASLGKITAKQFWESMGFGERSHEIESDYLNNYLEIDYDVIRFAESLKTKYKLGILSNDVSEWSLYLREKHKLNTLFDSATISGDVSIRKPNPEIYKLASQRLGINSSECIFIDDQQKNIKAAQLIGMKTIFFNRAGLSIQCVDSCEIVNANQLPIAMEDLLNNEKQQYKTSP